MAPILPFNPFTRHGRILFFSWALGGLLGFLAGQREGRQELLPSPRNIHCRSIHDKRPSRLIHPYLNKHLQGNTSSPNYTTVFQKLQTAFMAPHRLLWAKYIHSFSDPFKVRMTLHKWLLVPSPQSYSRHSTQLPIHLPQLGLLHGSSSGPGTEAGAWGFQQSETAAHPTPASASLPTQPSPRYPTAPASALWVPPASLPCACRPQSLCPPAQLGRQAHWAWPSAGQLPAAGGLLPEVPSGPLPPPPPPPPRRLQRPRQPRQEATPAAL